MCKEKWSKRYQFLRQNGSGCSIDQYDVTSNIEFRWVYYCDWFIPILSSIFKSANNFSVTFPFSKKIQFLVVAFLKSSSIEQAKNKPEPLFKNRRQQKPQGYLWYNNIAQAASPKVHEVRFGYSCSCCCQLLYVHLIHTFFGKTGWQMQFQWVRQLVSIFGGIFV